VHAALLGNADKLAVRHTNFVHACSGAGGQAI
jgi:hypothetical protein